MSLVTGITLPNNGDRIKVENYNDPITKILAQVNGNLDAANIAAGSLPWEAMASFTNKIPSTAMQDSANLEKFRQEAKLYYVASGLIWSALSGLNAQMTTGIYYNSSGVRISVAAIASRAFLASRDTYAYVDSTGGIGYLDVANNAARPTLPANSTWLARVVTNATAITSVTDIRQTALVSSSNVDWATLSRIQVMKTTNQSVNGSTALLYQAETIKTGDKLTFNNNREIIIGSGVSLVRVSFGAMADSAGSSPYLYCTLRKNNTIQSHFIDATTAAFKSVSGSMMIPVVAGDSINVGVDTGGGPLTLQSSRNQYLDVEVLA